MHALDKTEVIYDELSVKVSYIDILADESVHVLDKTEVTTEELSVKVCYFDSENVEKDDEEEEINLISDDENDMEVDIPTQPSKIDDKISNTKEINKLSLESNEPETVAEESMVCQSPEAIAPVAVSLTTKATHNENACQSEASETQNITRHSIEEVQPIRSSRTKTRKQNQTTTSDNSEKPRTSSRTKQRKGTATSSVSTDDGHDLDSGVHSEVETSSTRSTRSKMRKPKPAPISVSSDCSDGEDPFAIPKAPPARMTR